MNLLRFLLASLLLAATALARAEPIPTAGTPAPGFSLPDQSGKTRSLEDWRGKWLILYFYPKDDTPGCTAEARAFRDQAATLAALGAQAVGVSLDSAASHQAFADKHQLNFPLLADAEGVAARRYGALNNFGVVKFAKRVSFIIDPDGRIARAYPDVDAAAHAAQVVADLKALQIAMK